MFSLAEQSLIRNCLGYADMYHYKNPRLENMLAMPGVISAETEDLVRTHLTNFQTVESKILSRGLSVAGLKRADEMEFFKSSTYIELRQWGKMYVNRISIALGVPIYSDVFGTKGYLGDSYSQFGLASGGASNRIPLG